MLPEYQLEIVDCYNILIVKKLAQTSLIKKNIWFIMKT